MNQCIIIEKKENEYNHVQNNQVKSRNNDLFIFNKDNFDKIFIVYER